MLGTTVQLPRGADPVDPAEQVHLQRASVSLVRDGTDLAHSPHPTTTSPKADHKERGWRQLRPDWPSLRPLRQAERSLRAQPRAQSPGPAAPSKTVAAQA